MTTTENTSTSTVDFPFEVESETEIHTSTLAGTYGTEVSIVERDCANCGYDRARVDHAILPDVYQISCMACEHVHEEG